jgi:hypothetical protein
MTALESHAIASVNRHSACAGKLSWASPVTKASTRAGTSSPSRPGCRDTSARSERPSCTFRFARRCQERAGYMRSVASVVQATAPINRPVRIVRTLKRCLDIQDSRTHGVTGEVGRHTASTEQSCHSLMLAVNAGIRLLCFAQSRSADTRRSPDIDLYKRLFVQTHRQLTGGVKRRRAGQDWTAHGAQPSHHPWHRNTSCTVDSLVDHATAVGAAEHTVTIASRCRGRTVVWGRGPFESRHFCQWSLSENDPSKRQRRMSSTRRFHVTDQFTLQPTQTPSVRAL